MKYVFLLLSFYPLFAFTQAPTPESLGFRHMKIKVMNESTDLLIYSKKGTEDQRKPLLFFCQGSLPVPLMVYSDEGAFGVFPFNPEPLSEHYHLVIAGKPGIPLSAHQNSLRSDFSYLDEQKHYPVDFQKNNHLDYYIKRNLAIIKQLQKQKWISTKELVVAGHSEGSTIALNMASTSKKITKLIYSGGNPQGRITSMLHQARSAETAEREQAADYRSYWQDIVDHKDTDTAAIGDTYKATYSFSQPLAEKFARLKIPVLITYGSVDWCAPFVDAMQLDMMRRRQTNTSFISYTGCEHNFFPLDDAGKPNYQLFNWDNVAEDWRMWLIKL